MIKVYIADDEVPVVDGMKDFINTNFKSMKVVGSAYDGQTAMEEIRQQKPDIVITDVRMPGLNGVELSKKLREEMESVEILFVSGYDDVEYMRNALKVEAIDYILKPVNVAELKQVLSKFEIKFNKETEQRKYSIEMEQKLLQSMPALQQRFFSMLINRYRIGKQPAGFNRRVLCNRMKFLGLELPYEGKYMAIAMWIKNIDKLYGSDDYMEVEMFSFAIQNVMQEITAKYAKGYVFETEYNEFGAILCFKGDYSDRLLQMANEMHKTMLDIFSLETVLAIGDEVENISEIGLSWEFADDSVREKQYLGSNKTIYIAPHSREGRERHGKLSNVVTEIKGIINKRYGEKLSLNEIASEVYLTPTYVCLLFKEDTGITVNEYITKVRMAKAKEYLTNTNMKLPDIADKIGYSDASYFSKLFKRQVGMLPSEYRQQFKRH